MISAKKRDLQQQMEQAQQGGQAGPGQEELRKLENTLTGLEQSRERQERRIQVGLGWLSGALAGRRPVSSRSHVTPSADGGILLPWLFSVLTCFRRGSCNQHI